jgi:hypothetical protein
MKNVTANCGAKRVMSNFAKTFFNGLNVRLHKVVPSEHQGNYVYHYS